MCPARWCTGTSGRFSESASDFANETPTRSEPTRPGPCVTAMASRSLPDRSSPCRALRARLRRYRGCAGARQARARRRPIRCGYADLRGDDVRPIVHAPLVSETTAADVSSHDVSIPRISMKSGVAFLSLLTKHRQGLGIWRARDAALGDDAGDVLVRRDVEGRVPHFRVHRA